MTTCKVCSGSGSLNGHPDCPTPCLSCIDGVVGWIIVGSPYMDGDMVDLTYDENGNVAVYNTKEEAEYIGNDVAWASEFAEWKVISTLEWQENQQLVRKIVRKIIFGASE